MKERPILFSGEMVRAILAGKKTQTRRLIRPQWPAARTSSGYWGAGVAVPGNALKVRSDAYHVHTRLADGRDVVIYCPYGKEGDCLWVRETWDFRPWAGKVRISYGADATKRTFTAPADWHPSLRDGWRPSIFLPRWASRISLTIKSIRAEPLCNITDEDARSEGAAYRIAPGGDLAGAFDGAPGNIGYRAHFSGLWDSINGKRAAWSTNPWVWVVSFGVVQSHIEEEVEDEELDTEPPIDEDARRDR